MVQVGRDWLRRDHGAWLWDRAGQGTQLCASATWQCHSQIGVGICHGQKSRTSVRTQI